MDYDYSDAKKQICALIGAGMSAGAGIPTFRGEDGEWITERKVREAFEIDNFKNKLLDIDSHICRYQTLINALSNTFEREYV